MNHRRPFKSRREGELIMNALRNLIPSWRVSGIKKEYAILIGEVSLAIIAACWLAVFLSM